MKTDNQLVIDSEERDLLSVFMFGMKGLYSTQLTWNDLMPVVEKIMTIELPNGQYSKHVDFTIGNDGNGWIFWTKGIPGDQNQPQSYPQGNTMLEKVYKAVVEFIKWYNSQPSKPEN